ncbi:PrgI family protein [Evtepia gabavorous]|uniref:PrgI family protein n=1 Tax=Evtepia gabavorous TaxID=2211183 RepID=UPI003A8F1E53
MEIKIPKEVRQHRETIFFGLSARQFLCALFAVGIAVAVYLSLGETIGKETASWACILSAAPMAAAGFFTYNGLTLEQFAWAFLKSEVLCAGNRVFKAENIYYKVLGRKEREDFD